MGFGKMLFAALSGIPFLGLPFAHAMPFRRSSFGVLDDEPDGESPASPDFWLYIGIAAALVLAGGAFAGLTIAYVTDKS
jgi:metal transporter CNNM